MGEVSSKRNIEAIFRLTPSQQGMLMAHAFGANDAVERIEYDLNGLIDPALFTAAWDAIVARHGMLRTGFLWQNQATPTQFTLRSVPAALTIDDRRGDDETAQAAACEAQRGAPVSFNLVKPPLYRAALVILADRRAKLFLTLHHLLMDGESQLLLIRELLEAYGRLAEGRPWRPAPAASFSHYVAWLQVRDADAGERFWREALDGFSWPTPIGKAAERPFEGDGSGEAQIDLDAAAAARLSTVARTAGLTSNVLLQAAWALVLARAAPGGKVVFGTTLGERPELQPSIGNTVGLFINTVPVSVTVDRGAALSAWLKDLQGDFLSVREHGYFATSTIHEWSNVPAALPLFDSLLVFENYAGGGPPVAPDPEQLHLADFSGQGARTGYPLTLLVGIGDRIVVKAVHHRSAAREEDAQAALAAFAAALDALLLTLETGGPVGDVLRLIENAPTPTFFVRATADARDIVPPATELETRMLQIWRAVLGIEDVGVTEGWMALGGHSLLAAKLLDRLREDLSVDVKLSDLLAASTIRGLAERIGDRVGEGAPAVADLAIQPDPASQYEPFPLTDIQQAYWAGRSEIFVGGDIATHGYFEINGPMLDADRFNGAVNRLIARHPMLRTIVEDSGQQRTLAEVPRYTVELTDLRGLSETEREAELLAIRERMSHEVLSPDSWPLFNLRAERLTDESCRLHVSIDMLIVDGSSYHILFRDLAAIYLGREDELPVLDISFRDYVIAAESLKQGPAYASARDYWLARVDRLPSAPSLPLAIDPARLEHPRFARHRARLSKGEWDALARAAAALGVTRSSALGAIYAEVLRYWSAEPAFTLNLTLFNRLPLHPQVNEIVGDFTATSLLEIEENPGSRFVDRAQALQNRLWQDLDHRLFTGVEVLREIARRQRNATGAAMPVVFTSALALDGTDSSGEAVPTNAGFGGGDNYSSGQTSQVWLDFQVIEEDGGLSMILDAVENIFPAGLVAELMDAIRQLALQLTDPAAWARSRFEMLPPAQLNVRETFNATAREWDLPLLGGFLDGIAADDDRLAVVDSDLALDRSTLARWSLRLAARIQADGIGPGDLVAVEMDKGWRQVVAVLAVCRAGAAYVPIDARLPVERRRAILEQTGARLILRDAPGGEGADALLLGPDLLEALPDAPVTRSATLDDLAYVIFTSGSTGTPKGVVIDHRGASNTIRDVNEMLAVEAGDRILGLSALGFDLSVYDIFGVLVAGGALVLPDPERLQDPAHWEELMRAHGVSLFNGVPALMQILVDHLEAAGRRTPSTLRAVMMSGDWIPVALPDRIRALSDVPPALFSLGGATEASIWSVAYPIEQVDPSWDSIPYGRPMANQRMHVLKRDFSPAPDFVIGDLYIGGTGLAKGYWRDEERTRAAFVTHPETGEALYRTGDQAAHRRDGVLEFRGRTDSQVKIRGHRIELGEVETVIAAQPHVRACVAHVHGTEALRRQLVASLVLDEGADAEAVFKAAREAAAARLPAYMVPAFFQAIDEIPLSANGKVDRARLPSPLADAAAPMALDLAATGRLADLWFEILGQRPQSGSDHFFDLGGNSVSMLRLISRLRAEGHAIDVRRFFEAPTLEGMMHALAEGKPSEASEDGIAAAARRGRVRAWIRQAGEAERRALADRFAAGELSEEALVAALASHPEAAPPGDIALPLSFEQERMWFGARARDDGQYNLYQVVELPGKVESEDLAQAIGRIVVRHDALRARFPEGELGPYQRILPSDAPDLFTLEVIEPGGAAPEAVVDALLAREAAWRFDLAEGPLLRVVLAQSATGDTLLAINIHHIICDGWSIQSFLSELAAIGAGDETALPDLAVGYADFALWQREWLGSEEYREQLAHWQRRLAKLPTLNLPAPEPDAPTKGSAMLRFRIEPDVLAAITELARSSETTLFTALIAILAAALHESSGQEDFGIGTSVSTRSETELEPLIGLFLNQVVLRADLSGNPTPQRLVSRMREVVIEAFANRHVPFDAVVAAADPGRVRGGTPLFNVLATLQNAPRSGAGSPHRSWGPEQITAKFGLSLFFDQVDYGLDTLLVYDKSLVGEAAASSIATRFEDLAGAFGRRSDTPLNLLADNLRRNEVDTLAQKPLLKIGQRKRRAIQLDQLQATTEYTFPGNDLPFVVEAKLEVDFQAWLRENSGRLDTILRRNGAILFRGFHVDTTAALQSAQDALCVEVIKGYGDLPEEKDTQQIYKSTPYPQDRTILFHNESSHQPDWPVRQFFACVTAAEWGGETPIVDCRRVADRLGAEIVDEFERRGLLYIRTFLEGLDVSWQDFFKTGDREEVGRICARNGSTHHWYPDGTLQVRHGAQAVAYHPVTGERVFFNQIQLHEPHFLGEGEREALESLYGTEKLPRNVRYGDGEPIPPAILDEILATYEELAVAFPWQAGDMLMLDNMLVAHARSPFRGERKIIVALGDPYRHVARQAELA
jgi:amino acid adenylation domain-containing protein